MVAQTGGDWTVTRSIGSSSEVTLLRDISLLEFTDGNMLLRAAMVRDFDGDGTADILWRNDNTSISVWRMLDTQIDLQRSGYAGPTAGTGLTWTIAGVGDFGGDGKSDVLWRHEDGRVALWAMNGNQLLSTDELSVNPGTAWRISGVADFDGDLKSDILWRHQDGRVAVWKMNGTSTSAAEEVPVTMDAAWSMAGTGDFDGDGRSDILWRGQDGSVVIWRMNGTELNGSSHTTIITGGQSGIANPGSFWQVAGVGDFNGNGRSDILWRGEDGTVAIWEMNGNAIARSGVLTNAAGTPVNPGNLWTISGVGDFDGDRRSDILWRHQDDSVVIWDMNNFQLSTSSVLAAKPDDAWHIV